MIFDFWTAPSQRSSNKILKYIAATDMPANKMSKCITTYNAYRRGRISNTMDASTTVEVMKYWGPVSWALWNDQKAMPANFPESLWERHNGHNAAYQISALGVHAFYCYACRYSWSIEGQEALKAAGHARKKAPSKED